MVGEDGRFGQGARRLLLFFSSFSSFFFFLPSFLPYFLPAVPGGLRHVRPLMLAEPVWRIPGVGISSGAEFERF
jgi:hypothetical protein